MRKRNVIAVDLDATLAYFEASGDPLVIGPPIPEMVERVKGWLSSGPVPR